MLSQTLQTMLCFRHGNSKTTTYDEYHYHYQNADTNNLLAQHDYQFDNCNSQGNYVILAITSLVRKLSLNMHHKCKTQNQSVYTHLEHVEVLGFLKVSRIIAQIKTYQLRLL